MSIGLARCCTNGCQGRVRSASHVAFHELVSIGKQVHRAVNTHTHTQTENDRQRDLMFHKVSNCSKTAMGQKRTHQGGGTSKSK